MNKVEKLFERVIGVKPRDLQPRPTQPQMIKMMQKTVEKNAGVLKSEYLQLLGLKPGDLQPMPSQELMEKTIQIARQASHSPLSSFKPTEEPTVLFQIGDRNENPKDDPWVKIIKTVGDTISSAYIMGNREISDQNVSVVGSLIPESRWEMGDTD